MPDQSDSLSVNNDGTKKWFKDGKYHRLDGPAIELANGSKYWYIDGQCHRADGPAIEFADGRKVWCVDGKCHRVDGPAIEYVDGYKEWHINGIDISNQVNLWLLSNDVPTDHNQWSVSDKLLFRLTF
jgi:hypothetical protein